MAARWRQQPGWSHATSQSHQTLSFVTVLSERQTVYIIPFSRGHHFIPVKEKLSPCGIRFLPLFHLHNWSGLILCGKYKTTCIDAFWDQVWYHSLGLVWFSLSELPTVVILTRGGGKASFLGTPITFWIWRKRSLANAFPSQVMSFFIFGRGLKREDIIPFLMRGQANLLTASAVSRWDRWHKKAERKVELYFLCCDLFLRCLS